MALFLHGPALADELSGEVPKTEAASSKGGETETPPNEGGTRATEEAELDQPILSDRAELDRIIELYMSGDYQTCSSELSRLLDPESERKFEDRVIIEKGRLYFASCALLDGHRTKSRRALRAALEENPLMPSPDSLTFPPPVVSLFLEVRDEVQQLIAEREKEQLLQLRRENELARRRAEQREYRERLLEKLAREESIVRKNSRPLATVPFGVGQFQNGHEEVGALFLVSETLLLGTAVTSGIILADLTSKAAQGIVTDQERYNNQKHTAYRTLTWSSWAFVGVAALGILDAHLRFEPERRLSSRPRQLPPEIDIPPEPDAGDAPFQGEPSSEPTEDESANDGVPREDEEFRVDGQESRSSDFRVSPSLGLGPGGAQLFLFGTF